MRRLRVETFGGGTWLSDFSALTGLSTNLFGSMRNFAAQQGVSEEDALEKGMEAKAVEFVKAGAEVYRQV